MSRKKESIMLFEDVLSMMRRKWPVILVHEKPLSQKDVVIVHEAFALNAMLWVDVIGPRAWPRRSVLSWVARLCTANLDQIIGVLKLADNLLIGNTVFSTDELLAHIRYEFPGMAWVVTPLRLPLDSYFTEAKLGICDALQSIRSCLLFTSRLTLSSYEDAAEKSWDKFEANMERIAMVHTLPTEYMKNFVASLYPKSEREFLKRFLPKHGNGSVAEKRSNGRPLNELQKFKLTNTAAVQFLLRRAGLRPLPLPTAKTNRTSRLTTVPKGIDERRIVCPEPAALMFLEQGLARCLDFRFTRLRTHVDLYHAELSKDLAKTGSITRKWATLDQSSASDSVRWEFVASLFERVPYLQRLLGLCRSTHRVYPDGHVAKNDHFAPMGSALCFPIEVLVFSAIIEQAVHEVGGRSHYRVYGDDIVVEERYVDRVMELLEYFGFLLNKEKSYWGDDPFREACGGHYMNGADVTPLRLSRRFVGISSNSASAISDLVDLSNRTYNVYCRLHDVLANIVMKKTNYRIAVTTTIEDTSKLRVDSVVPDIPASVDRKKGRGNWNQIPESLRYVIKSRENPGLIHASGDLLLWKSLSQLELGQSQSDTEVNYSDDRDCYLSMQWTGCW